MAVRLKDLHSDVASMQTVEEKGRKKKETVRTCAFL